MKREIKRQKQSASPRAATTATADEDYEFTNMDYFADNENFDFGRVSCCYRIFSF